MEEGRGARRAVYGRDWTKGSVLGNLWGLSWPMMVTQTITTLGPTIDMIWVGKLGAASMAGVGVSGQLVQLISVVRMGLQTGTRALVSRSVGAGDEEEANRVAQQSLVVSVIFAVLMAIIGMFLSRQMLLLLGLKPEVVSEGAAYLRIQLLGMITMSFQMLGQSLMQASGDSQTPMKITIGARLLHVTLSPFLIFGWWIFPRLGVSGAALTALISQGIAGGLGMWMLYSGRTRLRLTMKGFRFDWKMIWRITKIGIPAMINGTERTSANLLVTWFVAPFGTFAVAAHSLMERIDNIIRMPAMGLGQGSGVLSGQALGAKQPERAEKTAWLAVGLFTGVMAVVSVLIWFSAGSIVRVFDAEPGLVDIATVFVKIQIVAFLVYGLDIVLLNSLNGIGDTWVPTLNTLITLWGVQMPLAFLLPRYPALGVYGVRWAMVIALAARAAVFAIYFRTGRWKRVKV